MPAIFDCLKYISLFVKALHFKHFNNTSSSIKPGTIGRFGKKDVFKLII